MAPERRRPRRRAAARRYRRPIERLNRPAEKFTFAGAGAAAILGFTQLDGLSGGDQVLMAVLFGSAGLVPALVSPIVDSLREHKESREAREDHYEVMEELEKRNVAAMERLAGIDSPADGEEPSEAPAGMVFQQVLGAKERQAGPEAQDAIGNGS